MTIETKDYLDANAPSTIPLIKENYPHVYASIIQFWGSKDFLEYIGQLVLSDCHKTRKGFPLDVMRELFKLQQMHDIQYPQFMVSDDIWHIRNN